MKCNENIQGENGGLKMTIEKAMSLSKEEFEMLDKQYEGFDKESYINHRVHEPQETFYDFLEKGCERIRNIRLFTKTY